MQLLWFALWHQILHEFKTSITEEQHEKMDKESEWSLWLKCWLYNFETTENKKWHINFQEETNQTPLGSDCHGLSFCASTKFILNRDWKYFTVLLLYLHYDLHDSLLLIYDLIQIYLFWIRLDLLLCQKHADLTYCKCIESFTQLVPT